MSLYIIEIVKIFPKVFNVVAMEKYKVKSFCIKFVERTLILSSEIYPYMVQLLMCIQCLILSDLFSLVPQSLATCCPKSGILDLPNSSQWLLFSSLLVL